MHDEWLMKKIELVYALMSGDIYMARINDDGTMNLRNRRIATDDVMKAAAEWFIGNKKTVAHSYKSDVFGRYLANVWYEDGKRSLNDDLRDAGLLKENSKWNEG